MKYACKLVDYLVKLNTWLDMFIYCHLRCLRAYWLYDVILYVYGLFMLDLDALLWLVNIYNVDCKYGCVSQPCVTHGQVI